MSSNELVKQRSEKGCDDSKFNYFKLSPNIPKPVDCPLHLRFFLSLYLRAHYTSSDFL